MVILENPRAEGKEQGEEAEGEGGNGCLLFHGHQGRFGRRRSPGAAAGPQTSGGAEEHFSVSAAESEAGPELSAGERAGEEGERGDSMREEDELRVRAGF